MKTLDSFIAELTALGKKSFEAEHWYKLANVFVGKKNKNYKEALIIVLSVHIGLERVFNIFIKKLLNLVGYRNMDIECNFGKKFGIIKKLGILTNDSANDVDKINELRIDFAHGLNKTNFRYKGKSIFSEETIDCIIADFKEVHAGILSKMLNIDEIVKTFSKEKIKKLLEEKLGKKKLR